MESNLMHFFKDERKNENTSSDSATFKLPAALWTITWGRPNSVTQASTAALMAAGSLISHCTGNTLFPVNLEMSEAVSSKTGSLLKMFKNKEFKIAI